MINGSPSENIAAGEEQNTTTFMKDAISKGLESKLDITEF